MKSTYIVFGVVITIGLVWLIVWGDFDEWRYSKDLHCMTFQNSRKVEICKSMEKHQEYSFLGHAIISAGYRSSFTTAKKAWCELSLTDADLNLLKDMQYDNSLSPQLMDGSGLLYSLLDAKLNQNSNLYIGSIYDPSSSDYLIKDGCIE